MISIIRRTEIYPTSPHIHHLRTYSVEIPWEDVTKILGHEHEGSPEDDQSLITYLLRYCDAPEWVKDATGRIDDKAWLLKGCNG